MHSNLLPQHLLGFNLQLADYIYTKIVLRNFCELCDDMNVDKELLVKKLKAAGFEYSKENNKFW